MKLNFSPQWMIWATTVHKIQIFEFKTFVTLAFTAQEQGIYEDASKSWDKRVKFCNFVQCHIFVSYLTCYCFIKGVLNIKRYQHCNQKILNVI
jgi:hypothetical protein